MPSWLNTDDGMIYHHFSPDGIIVKVVKTCGSCFTSFQDNADVPGVCQQFNPQLKLSERGIITILEDAFSNPSNLKVVGTVLHVSTSIEKLTFSWTFKWEFELSPCMNTINEVFNPILNSMMLLIEEKNSLITLIKKKDKEIAEFRSLGITLSKKSKVSAPYDQAKTLKNVSVPVRSTSDILSNQQFRDAVSKSYETQNVSTVISPSKKKRVVTEVGITFDDSLSQPDQVFTDEDIFASAASSKLEGEVKLEDEINIPEDNGLHAVKSDIPVVKRKKPRRL